MTETTTIALGEVVPSRAANVPKRGLLARVSKLIVRRGIRETPEESTHFDRTAFVRGRFEDREYVKLVTGTSRVYIFDYRDRELLFPLQLYLGNSIFFTCPFQSSSAVKLTTDLEGDNHPPALESADIVPVDGPRVFYYHNEGYRGRRALQTSANFLLGLGGILEDEPLAPIVVIGEESGDSGNRYVPFQKFRLRE